MATLVFTDGFLSVGGNDLSDDVSQISLSFTADDVQDTAMGDSWRTRKAGGDVLKDVSLNVTFNQDFAASQLDSILWGFFTGSTNPTVIVRPVASTAVGSDNPNYTGAIAVLDYTPISGSVGDLATVGITWPGDGAWTRATS